MNYYVACIASVKARSWPLFHWLTCCCESPVLSRLNLLKSENFIFGSELRLAGHFFKIPKSDKALLTSFAVSNYQRASPFSQSLTCHRKTLGCTWQSLSIGWWGPRLKTAAPLPHTQKKPQGPLFPFRPSLRKPVGPLWPPELVLLCTRPGPELNWRRFSPAASLPSGTS